MQWLELSSVISSVIRPRICLTLRFLTHVTGNMARKLACQASCQLPNTALNKPFSFP